MSLWFGPICMLTWKKWNYKYCEQLHLGGITIIMAHLRKMKNSNTLDVVMFPRRFLFYFQKDMGVLAMKVCLMKFVFFLALNLKQKMEFDIYHCFYKCNIPFHVVDILTWRNMINFVARVWLDNHENSKRIVTNNIFTRRGMECHEWPWVFKVILVKYNCHVWVEWHEKRNSHKHFGLFLQRIHIVGCDQHIEFSWRLFDPNEYAFEHIKSTIEIVGLNNVVQIITNNALNCKQMG